MLPILTNLKVVHHTLAYSKIILHMSASTHAVYAVLCKLNKIRCNQNHPLYGALPLPYVPVWVTHNALVAHRYTYVPPRCLRCSAVPLFLSLCPCGMILLTLYLMVWYWWVSRSGATLLYWPKLLDPLLSSTVFRFLFFLSVGWYCGLGSLD